MSEIYGAEHLLRLFGTSWVTLCTWDTQAPFDVLSV
jgi:hypothetical protein